MIRIICVGKIKEEYLIEAVKDYSKRISKYHKFEIVEFPDEGKLDKASQIKKESDKILNFLGNSYNILLDRQGEMVDSISLSKKIEDIFISNSNINFIIGGSYGVSEEIKEKSNFILSFSKMTFPHQLFRILLLEQIYRACKISNNEEYHK